MSDEARNPFAEPAVGLPEIVSPGIGAIDVPPNPDQEPSTTPHSTAVRFAAFATVKLLAKVEFVGGALGGTLITHHYSGNPSVVWGVPAVLAAGISLSEYLQTQWGLDKIADPSARRARKYSRLSDLAALTMASSQGAGANLAYNDAVGLPNTPLRRKLQSTAYGVGVGLWSSRVPPWRYGGDEAPKLLRAAEENPTKAAVVLVAGSAALFGAMEGAKKTRHRFHNRRDFINQYVRH